MREMVSKARFDKMTISVLISRCTRGVYPAFAGVKPIAAVLTAAEGMRGTKGGAV